jgi:hypothetical protein
MRLGGAAAAGAAGAQAATAGAPVAVGWRAVPLLPPFSPTIYPENALKFSKVVEGKWL